MRRDGRISNRARSYARLVRLTGSFDRDRYVDSDGTSRTSKVADEDVPRGLPRSDGYVDNRFSPRYYEVVDTDSEPTAVVDRFGSIVRQSSAVCCQLPPFVGGYMCRHDRAPGVIDRNALLVGVVLQVALLATAASVPPLRHPVFGPLALAAVGLFGGAVVGGLVGGSRRARAYHGLLSGVGGGLVFAAWLWYTLVANVYLGAFYGVAYVVATAGIPPELATRYDALVPVALGAFGAVLYAVEGALAAGLVPSGWVAPPPWYPS